METDYLVIGTGAAGLAFADTLLRQSTAHITLVDRRATPGGHWNDAYPFVTLHQPSAFYGANSLALGSGRKDSSGHNAGLYELASGAEVNAYFHQLLHHHLLPSGRVRHLPMSDFQGMADGCARVVSLLSGAEHDIAVRRKLVDASFYSPNVPATSPPRFDVAEGVRLVTPTQLAQLGRADAPRPGGYCILGAGKTAMDVGVWLLDRGVPPQAIHWVVPRDSWVVDRRTTQPGLEFFEAFIGGQLRQMQALAAATDTDDLFLRLEAAGQVLRIDPQQTPRMFHLATLSPGEVQALRRIRQVLRQGRVLAIEPDALVLEGARVPMAAGTLTIDCTASAVEPRAAVPVFQPGRIVPQLMRAPLVSFSAALCAYVEARCGDDDTLKNTLCTPVPFPHRLDDYVACLLGNAVNQARWSQDKGLRQWMRESRLDGFAQMIANLDPGDTERLTLLAALREQTAAAMPNAQRLIAANAAAALH
jgi:hypothetical protein